MNPSNPEESNMVVVAPTTLTGLSPEYPRLLASPSSFGPVLFPLPTPRNSFGPVLVQPPLTPNSCGPVLFPRPTPLNPFGPVLVRSPSTPNRDFRPEIQPDERSLYLTFSNGFPLTEKQIYDFFNRLYESYVEDVHVHKPSGGGKPSLFGKVTFKRADIPNLVLNYKEKVCLNVDGFPLVCKKFVSKRTTES